MKKPSRNSYKGTMSGLPQNKIDFEYQNQHQEKAHEAFVKKGTMSTTPIVKNSSDKNVKRKPI